MAQKITMVLLVVFAGFGLFMLGKYQEATTSNLNKTVNENPTLPPASPIPTVSQPTNTSQQGVTPNKPQTKRAIAIPQIGKTLYCNDAGYDAVNNVVNLLQKELDNGNSLRAEIEGCVTSCANKKDEIIEMCWEKSDVESCLRECPNNCQSQISGRFEQGKKNITDYTTSINQLAQQFCYNQP